MAADLLLVDRHDAITVLTLNRPQELNTLTADLIQRLDKEISRLRENRSTRAVVITGAGKAFCAGVEVGKESYDPLKARLFLKNLNRVFDALEQLPQPVVAAINGAAVAGGLELALACTLRVASSRAKLGLPEVRLGLVAAIGTTHRLPRLVGYGRATEMCLLGDLVEASTAQEWGLVNRTSAPDCVLEKALDIASQLAEGPPVALGLLKDALHANATGGATSAALLEILSASVNHSTTDKLEGMAAFLEKRRPSFKGE